MYKDLFTWGPSPWSYPDNHFLFVLYCLLAYEGTFQLYFIKKKFGLKAKCPDFFCLNEYRINSFSAQIDPFKKA